MQSIIAWSFLLGAVALIARAIADAIARTAATRAALDIELRLIEKLDSAEAVANYLASSAQRPLAGASTSSAQANLAINAVQVAIIAFVIGFAVLLVNAIIPSSDPNEGVLYFGVLLIALSVGFAAVAFVTRKLLVAWTKPSSPSSI
jgi:hypothetical protein